MRETIFDNYLSNKIKVGISQQISTFNLGLLCLADGSEMLVLGLTQAQIQEEFQVSQYQMSILSSTLFLVWGITSIYFGQITDVIGRRTPYLVACFGQAITAFLSAFCQNYTQLLIIRSLFAIFMGLGTPITPTYVSELLPIEKRGKYQSIMYSMYTFGQIITVILASLFMENIRVGNWRLLIGWTSVPGFIAFVSSYYFIQESPRYLLLKGQQQNNQQIIEKSFQILSNTGKQNNSQTFQDLNNQEKQDLLDWALYINENNNTQNKIQINQNNINSFLDSIKQLFSKKLKFQTIKLMTIWFTVSFVYYGLMFQLPTIISKILMQQNDMDIDVFDQKPKQSEFTLILYSALVEYPSTFLAYLLIENNKVGRKNSLFWSFLISSICCYVCYLHPFYDNYFQYSILGIKFFINICFLTCQVVTTEVYPTFLRSTGMGFNMSICRFGAVIMPQVSQIFYGLGNTGPLLFCSLFCLLSSISAFQLNNETRGRALDFYQELKEIENQNPKNTQKN